MPKAKKNTRAKAPKTSISLSDLETRLKTLERRVAILEAKQPKPTLADSMNEPARTGARVGHEIAEETVYVRDAEKPGS